MAKTIKVKMVKLPNLNSMSDDEIDTLEDSIKDVIKNKVDDGYDIAGIAGGDSFALIIFQKTT